MPVGSVQVKLRGPVLNGQAPPIIKEALTGAVSDLVAKGERIHVWQPPWTPWA